MAIAPEVSASPAPPVAAGDTATSPATTTTTVEQMKKQAAATVAASTTTPSGEAGEKERTVTEAVKANGHTNGELTCPTSYCLSCW